VTILDDIWAVQDRTDLPDPEKARQVALLKASAWVGLPLPMTVGSITITGLTVNGPVVELTGTGGSISWPLQLVNTPIAVPNGAGPSYDRAQQGWQINPGAILRDILGRFQ
jgi:hypothetical protein